MSPLNSECHAGAGEVFAALSTCPKSLRPVREIQAGNSSRQERVGGLQQTGPGPQSDHLPPSIRNSTPSWGKLIIQFKNYITMFIQYFI